MEDFKNKFNFLKRESEVKRVKLKYPNKIPIYLTKGKLNNTMEEFEKKKFLVSGGMKMISFVNTIKNQFKLNSDDTLFLMINDKMMADNSESISNVYDEYKDDDGFLYISYYQENAFGK